MDVSSWKNYGEKMGFDKFFDEKQKIRTLEEVEEIIKEERKRFKCGACGGGKVGHTLSCTCLSDLLAKLTSLKQDSGEIKK